MVRAIWNGAVLAESGDTEMVEGNHYFPRDSVSAEFTAPSAKTSICPWKGVASYLDVTVDGKTNAGAAWYYPDPKPAAAGIAGYVAFWKGVEVVDDETDPPPARRRIFGMRR